MFKTRVVSCSSPPLVNKMWVVASPCLSDEIEDLRSGDIGLTDYLSVVGGGELKSELTLTSFSAEVACSALDGFLAPAPSVNSKLSFSLRRRVELRLGLIT